MNAHAPEDVRLMGTMESLRRHLSVQRGGRSVSFGRKSMLTLKLVLKFEGNR